MMSTTILMTVVSTSIACNAQLGPEPVKGTQATNLAVMPLELGLSIYLNQVPTTIAFDVASRFMLTTTKERLNAAKTMHDIVPVDPRHEIVSYSSVSIQVIENNKQTDMVELGGGPELSPAQLKLLRSLDYSSNFVIRAEFKVKERATGQVHSSYATPHITIVPGKEAVNSAGKNALIDHVKAGTSGFRYMVEAGKLRPGQIDFTVNEEGGITDVELSSSSGYPLMDRKMIELIGTLPGRWEPATNAAGEKVKQVFVFSFGTVGC